MRCTHCGAIIPDDQVVCPECGAEMARIRLQYPEATLKELGMMLDPPVGKSGVNHRLRKLSAIADALRSKEEKLL